MLTSNPETKPFTDETKIGDHAAQQPLSGVGVVVQTGAVNGRGGFVYMAKSETKSETASA